MKQAFAMIVLGMALFAGCGGKDCQELCEEAQAGSCTSVTGNCGSFCGALDSVQGASGCSDEREAYEDCLNGKDNVCDVGCGTEETQFENCFTAYCLTNATNAACITLATSF